MIVKENETFILDNPYEKNLRHFLKQIYWAIKTLFYSIKYRLIRVENNSKKYNVSICAIFKNEAPYLREWIEFNHLVGIEHFYLYNNNSEDDYEAILEPYIEKGLVTLVQWPYQQKQMESYKDCIEKYSGETKWLGFIDIDEFVVPKSTDNVYNFLRKFENRGAVDIYWRLYGSSGLIERDLTGLVTEDFKVCWEKYCDIGKCFYNTAFGFDFNSERNSCLHHWFWANHKGTNLPPVNIFGHICIGNRNVVNKSDFPIQINHYFTKSYREYAAKRAKGDVYFKINPHDEEYFYEHEMKCTSVDYSAYKYLIKLKLEMGKE